MERGKVDDVTIAHRAREVGNGVIAEARPEYERVIPQAARETIVAGEPGYQIIARRADQYIVGRCAKDRIDASASPRNCDVDPTVDVGRRLILYAVVEAVDTCKAGIGRVGEASIRVHGHGAVGG